MKKAGKYMFNVILFISWFCSSALVAGVLTGELDKSSGSLDDEFVYTLTIEGSYTGDLSFPKLEAFEVRRGGFSQSTQIINGKMSSSQQIQYYLIPQTTGKFTIPAVSLKVDGELLQTLPIDVEVVKSVTNPNAKNELPFFVERSFSKTKVYVGEPVVVTDRIYSKINLIDGEISRQDFPAEFRAINIQDEKRFEQQISGQRYSVTEFTSVLVPIKNGSFNIKAAVFVGSYAKTPQRGLQRRFWNNLLGPQSISKKKVRTKEQMVEVIRLPSAGRSKEFSGLVGVFKIQGGLDTSNVLVGESINLNVQVIGDSLTDSMANPQINIDNSIKVYEEKPVSNDQIDAGGIEGQRVFKAALVPTLAGTYSGPKVTVQTFNPSLKSYETLSLDLNEIIVTGGASRANSTKNDASMAAGKASSEVSKKEVTLEKDDIKNLRSFKEAYFDGVVSASDYLIGFCVAVSGFLLALLGLIYRIYKKTSPQRSLNARVRRALKVYKDSSNQLQHKLELGDIDTAAQEARSSLLGYLSDRFLIESHRLTSYELLETLQKKSLHEDSVHELAKILKSWETIIYGGAKGTHDTSYCLDLLNKSNRIIERLDDYAAN